jgi:hypothetical protein
MSDRQSTASPADPEPGRRISRKQRVGLFLHRGLDKWLSPFGVLVYRRTKGGITRPWKVDALLLTTRGRRSGRERTVILQFLPDGDAMIVAADWWRRILRRDPSYERYARATRRTIPVVRLVPGLEAG